MTICFDSTFSLRIVTLIRSTRLFLARYQQAANQVRKGDTHTHTYIEFIIRDSHSDICNNSQT